MAKKKTTEPRFTCSMLDCWSTCPRKCYWAFIRKLEPTKHNWNLLGGTLIHKGLEAWYSGGFDSKHAIGIVNDEAVGISAHLGYMSVEDAAELDKYRAMAQGFILGSEKLYHDQKDWAVLAVEAVFEDVRIGGYLFNGTIDLIASAGKTPFVADHKSRSRVTGDVLLALPLQHQSILYPAVASVVAGKPINKMVYSFLVKPGIYTRKTESLPEFLNRMTATIVDEPSKYMFREEVRVGSKRLARLLPSIKASCRRIMRLVEKNAGIAAWERSPTACTQYGQACEFLPLCLKGESPDVMLQYKTREDRYENGV